MSALDCLPLECLFCEKNKSLCYLNQCFSSFYYPQLNAILVFEIFIQCSPPFDLFNILYLSLKPYNRDVYNSFRFPGLDDELLSFKDSTKLNWSL